MKPDIAIEELQRQVFELREQLKRTNERVATLEQEAVRNRLSDPSPMYREDFWFDPTSIPGPGLIKIGDTVPAPVTVISASDNTNDK